MWIAESAAVGFFRATRRAFWVFDELNLDIIGALLKYESDISSIERHQQWKGIRNFGHTQIIHGRIAT